jgi:TolA-binding protein
MKYKSLVLLFLLAGCALANKPQSHASMNVPVKTPAVKPTVDKPDDFSFQKERAAILSAKYRTGTGPTVPTVSGFIKFEELTADYEKNDSRAFNNHFAAFIKTYSRSDYIDDAYYLNGLMNLADKNYGKAILAFNKIIKDYPNGNRVEAAHFAKAATLKKMNLKNLAAEAFAETAKKYPGSPEALRASDELKLVK